MKIHERSGAPQDARPASGSPAPDDRAREAAAVEIRAAIELIASRPDYRVLLCGMATDARLVASLDDLAASAGVVLERRIRKGGGLDVVVRTA
jgi:hypothetical protein